MHFSRRRPAIVAFIELVNCHIERWRHVTIDILSDTLHPLSVTPAPLLETIAVFAALSDQDMRPPNKVKLFDGARTPRLREVHISRGNGIDWRTQFPPTLSKLIINHLEYKGASLSDILSIFVSCRDITSLEISWTKVDLEPDQSWPTQPPVELPNLKELKLWYLEAQVIQDFLLRLRFPKDCVINLASHLPHNNPSTFLNLMLSRYIDDLDDGFFDQLTISIDCSSNFLTAKGPRWNLAFDLLDVRAVRDAVLWFNGAELVETNGCSQSSTRDILVSLNLSGGVLTGDFISLRPIWDLHCIKRVALNNDDVSLLCHPVRIAAGDGKQYWAFPGMMELHIYRCKDLNSARDLVKKREANRGVHAASLQRIEFGDKFEEDSADPPPDSLFTLLEVLDEDAQLYWYRERVVRD
ncbi:hypothetical protein FS837_007379 [Tulasnella sp. UAMH 9824]|nr:hypothetical protein FS837_007379 [Tulasnella sp. UAMH 9824]